MTLSLTMRSSHVKEKQMMLSPIVDWGKLSGSFASSYARKDLKEQYPEAADFPYVASSAVLSTDLVIV